MKKRFYTSLKGKVVLASIAGLLTIFIIHSAIQFAFKEITDNIEQLSTPNEKLQTLNTLFRDISQLNHRQREEAARMHQNPSLNFINESNSVYNTIDSLKHIFIHDSIQSQRIEDIERLLKKREALFLRFLQIQYNQTNLPNKKDFIKKLTGSLQSDNNRQGQIITHTESTTTRKVTSDTIREERQGFFQRLFGRSEPEEDKEIILSETTIDETTTVSSDTLSPIQPDTLFAILEKSIDSMRVHQQQESARIQNQELQLLNTNSMIIYEIIEIINAVEQEEISRVNANTRKTFQIAGTAISQLNLIAIAFVITSVVLVLLIVIDITKSNNYRQQLETAHAASRKEAENKQRFLSNMSHEIRTPLQSIFGYAEQEKQSNNNTNIRAIYHSANHLLDIVNEVLDYSKVTSGLLHFDEKPFSIYEQVNSVATAMIPLAEKKGISLNISIQENKQDIVNGDPYRLKQIIYNLTGNAIKFTHKGEVNITLNTISNKNTLILKLEIKDTGIGIKKEQLSTIFDEYQQTDLSITEKYGGTGLGLNIVKSLTELQNGKIEVVSTYGKGTSFYVTIPYKKAETTHHKTESEVSTFNKTESSVWFADDDSLILNLASSILKNREIQHKTFENGKVLIDHFINDKSARIIFLDMKMPELNGIETCKKIRKITENNPEYKIFALTAQTFPEEHEAILKAGFNKVIVKPFRESDILKAIGESVEEKKSKKTEVNLDHIIKMAGNDSKLAISILESIVLESQNDLTQIKKELWLSNWQNLSLLIHKMAGRVGQAGDIEYSKKLRECEHQINKGIRNENLKTLIRQQINNGNTFINHLKKAISAKLSEQ